MIVSYIEFMTNGDKTQETFNKCLAMARRSVVADHDNTIIIHIVSSAEYNEVKFVARISYEDDKVNIVYDEAILSKFGLVKPTDDEADEYVWVVSFNQVCDYEQLSNDFRVYANKEDAIKFFKELIKNEKKSIDEEIGGEIDNWVLDENFSEKRGIGSWEYYLDGYASSDHSYVYLEKKKIRTK